MAFLDFLLTSQQKKEKVATKVGLNSGLFTECPVCRDVTEAQNQDGLHEKTDILIHKLISENDPMVSLFRGDEVELQNTVADVAGKLPYHCTCENLSG